MALWIASTEQWLGSQEGPQDRARSCRRLGVNSLPLGRAALFLPLLLGTESGCIGNRIIHSVPPTPLELAEFLAAGPSVEEIDTDKLVAVNIGKPYKLVSGDLITLTLPAKVFSDYEPETGDSRDMKSRVGKDGKVRLPQLGPFPISGLTLSEVEEAIASAYHSPEYLKERPNVVCAVDEYRTVSVAVMGAVNTPGIYGLRSDRLSVLGALMAAGGIHPDRGASQIRILRPAEDDIEPEAVPVRSTDIPLQDLLLGGGETIVVEPRTDRQFSVVGLVKKVGIFPYPEPRQYNLMQAIATAGGVDATAAPRFATIYRKKTNGEVIAATFRIDGLALQHGSNIPIKDGDVIAIEHTEGSWFRSFLSDVFGFRLSGSGTTSL